tara:strand:+ start:416 stop:577 length:162 start_codon:yes stop_codon:yes gene_type:complete
MTQNRILITGGAGFIASHVAHLIAEKYPSYKVKVEVFVIRALAVEASEYDIED